MSVKDAGSGSSFLQEVEQRLDAKDEATELNDYEWEVRNRKWEDEKAKVEHQMLNNTIWNMLFTKHKGPEEDLRPEQRLEGGGDNANKGEMVRKSNFEAAAKGVTAVDSNQSASGNNVLKRPVNQRLKKITAVSLPSGPTWKVPKFSRSELFKYLKDWDTSSYGKRDRIIIDFINVYRTSEKMYDMDAVFWNGGSLIFCRFVVGMHICFLRHRKVWHYFQALGILVKSLQGDRFAEEFMRLGGIALIFQVVRVQESGTRDKLNACRFLVELMESRGGHGVKRFILDTPNFLESLIDSLTMCKDHAVIDNCGQIFLNLCIEITPHNVELVFNFIMHAIPCDFNPILQAMAFKVMQSLVRLKASLSERCLKPIVDNLKTENNELLVELGNLSLAILQTKFGDELIKTLMAVAEGIHLRESFHSTFRPHNIRKQAKAERETNAQELIKTLEKREKIRAKKLKFDHFMQQAGALFVLNQMMTHQNEFVNEFISKGIFGLSLKTLGACPHWQVQGQAITMIRYLQHVSLECAISYHLMLPLSLMKYILEKPEECLRYFTSPICVFCRKLGRFTLRMWPLWIEKVVEPAKMYGNGTQIPKDLFKMSKMARKVHEIQNAIADLMDSPVMEAASLPIEDEDGGHYYLQDFLDSSDDEENLAQYKDGTALIRGDDRFESFRGYLDEQDFQMSEDRLDARVDVAKPSVLMKLDDDGELDAYQIAILEDAQKNKADKSPTRSDPEDEHHAALQNRTVGSAELQDAFIDL